MERESGRVIKKVNGSRVYVTQISNVVTSRRRQIEEEITPLSEGRLTPLVFSAVASRHWMRKLQSDV